MSSPFTGMSSRNIRRVGHKVLLLSHKTVLSLMDTRHGNGSSGHTYTRSNSPTFHPRKGMLKYAVEDEQVYTSLLKNHRIRW